MSVLNKITQEKINELRSVLENKHITYLPKELNSNSYIFPNVPQNEKYFDNLSNGIAAYYYLFSIRSLTNYSTLWLGLANEHYRRTGYFWSGVDPDETEVISYLKNEIFDCLDDMSYQPGCVLLWYANKFYPYIEFTSCDDDLNGVLPLE